MIDGKQENPQTELNNKSTQEILDNVQQTILRMRDVQEPRHKKARNHRRWHRTWSPKAKLRKKARRKIAYASKLYNRQRAKRK